MGLHVEPEHDPLIKQVSRVDLNMSRTCLTSTHDLFINRLVVLSLQVVSDFATPIHCCFQRPLMVGCHECQVYCSTQEWHFHPSQTWILLAVNGCFGLKDMLIVLLSAIKPIWLQRALSNNEVLIMVRHLVRSSNQSQFVLLLPLLFLQIGSFVNLMSLLPLLFLQIGSSVNLMSWMPLCMVFYLKMCIWLNHQVSFIFLFHSMFVTFARHFMDSSKPYGPRIPA